MKQQLHQLSVSFAQITNEALMAWDPQLEYKLYLMQEQLLLLKKNEDVLSFDGSLEDETKSVMTSTGLPDAIHAHTHTRILILSNSQRLSAFLHAITCHKPD